MRLESYVAETRHETSSRILSARTKASVRELYSDVATCTKQMWPNVFQKREITHNFWLCTSRVRIVVA